MQDIAASMDSNRDSEIAELRAALEKERGARLDAEARHRRLFRALPIMAHRLDAEARIIDVSDRWLEGLGYTREEVVGRRPAELMPEAARQRMLDDILPELGRTGRFDDVDLQLVRKSGEVLDMVISAAVELSEDGRLLGVTGIMRDNTDQKRASQALRESEERYRTLIDVVPIGLFVRVGAAISYINQTGVELLGAKSAAELIGTPALSVVHPDHRAEVVERMKALNRGIRVPGAELRMVGRDGREFSADIIGIPVTFHGVPASLVGFQDLTDRKKGEEAVRRAKLQEELLRVKEDTLRAISTPLLPVSERVVVMPLVGVVDEARVQRMLEVLLQGISSHKAAIAVLDVTGTPSIEMGAAEALVRAARAARLLGAEVVLSGISPQMAQAMAEGGVETGGIMVKGTLKDSIAYALASGKSGGR
jgi:rsbT co-antagonist protein RsbR